MLAGNGMKQALTRQQAGLQHHESYTGGRWESMGREVADACIGIMRILVLGCGYENLFRDSTPHDLAGHM